MRPRELPNLTTTDRPTMTSDQGGGLHPGASAGTSRWLLTGSMVLLLAAGITYSIASSSAGNASASVESGRRASGEAAQAIRSSGSDGHETPPRGWSMDPQVSLR